MIPAHSSRTKNVGWGEGAWGGTGGKSGVTETRGKPGRTPCRARSARLCTNRPVVVCSREQGWFVIGEECALFTATRLLLATRLAGSPAGPAAEPPAPSSHRYFGPRFLTWALCCDTPGAGSTQRSSLGRGCSALTPGMLPAKPQAAFWSHPPLLHTSPTRSHPGGVIFSLFPAQASGRENFTAFISGSN